MLIDVSISGMLVRVDTLTASGAVLVLDLEWEGTVIQLRGRVVRVVPARSGDRMTWVEVSEYDTALQFEPLSGDTSATLHELIARAGGH
jgi:hypothetical protein